MSKKTTSCTKQECKFNFKGECDILNNTDFGKRECPFFKKKIEQKQKTIDEELDKLLED